MKVKLPVTALTVPSKCAKPTPLPRAYHLASSLPPSLPLYPLPVSLLLSLTSYPSHHHHSTGDRLDSSPLNARTSPHSLLAPNLRHCLVHLASIIPLSFSSFLDTLSLPHIPYHSTGDFPELLSLNLPDIRSLLSHSAKSSPINI